MLPDVPRASLYRHLRLLVGAGLLSIVEEIPVRQFLRFKERVADGSSPEQDVALEIDLERQKVGIFGKITRLDTPLEEGNRVEIYRPITADPETVERRDVS